MSRRRAGGSFWFLILFLAISLPAVAQSDKRKKPIKQEEMDKLTCEQQKRAYRASEACFARYRDPQTKKLHPTAYSRCQELKQPNC